MAFLAPLFLAGLAAIALPVLLHLRKNRPKETVAFSSLMFLEASPPVTKRRSRLQDVVLLILRCVALALLILAFARPFFPAENDTPVTSTTGTLNFILIDTSASMRDGPLEKSLALTREIIGEIPDGDAIALATFSDRLKVLLDPERARSLPESGRRSAALALLTEVRAGWQSTRLDSALLAATAAAGEDGPVKIHVVGDLQQGAVVDRLRGETWPDQLQMGFHPVTPDAGWTNAGVSMLPPDGETRRVLVTNAAGSAKSDFTLAWSGSASRSDISVPPGESAAFEAPPDVPAEGEVVLAGDGFAFDNRAPWITPDRPVAQIWYPDPAEAGDSAEGAYFLNRAMQATPDYAVEIVSALPEEAPALSVTGGMLDTAAIAGMRRIVEAGGAALFTVRDPGSARAIPQILGTTAGDAVEATVDDHARLGEIDFTSAVFAPFADPRYSDFSGIRFWKYRVLPEPLVAHGKVLARFDSGDPAWIAFPLGQGTLHVLTSTWRPADSQLALTTKFPPLLHSLLDLPPAAHGIHLVGHAGIESPGIHTEAGRKIAVQLDPAESEITPLPEAELRALGLPTGPPPAAAASREISIALSNAEQESRQRVGWWLLVGAAVFFLAETLWAAFAGGRPTPVTS